MLNNFDIQHDRSKLFLFAGIFISILIIFLSVLLAVNRTRLSSRAQIPSETIFSLDNSYLFASPIKAFADNKSVIRITIFILNRQGLGVEGQKVTLKISKDLVVEETQPFTDNLGRAIFDVTSSNPGNYTIIAEVSGVTLLQQVSISFH